MAARRSWRPRGRGFGRSVIEDLAATSLGGTAQLSFAPEGVTWVLEAPLSNLQGHPRRTV